MKYKIVITVAIIIAILLLGYLSVYIRQLGHSNDSKLNTALNKETIEKKHPNNTINDNRDNLSQPPINTHKENNTQTKDNATEHTEKSVKIAELIDKLRKLIKEKINFPFESNPLYNEYIFALKNIGGDALSQLKKVILNRQEDLELRRALIQVVGNIKSETALSFLLDLFKTTTYEPVIRSEALYTALRNFEGKDIFDTIKLVFEGDKNYKGRYSLALSMGETKETRAVPVLVRALKSDLDKETRYHSAIALGNFIEDIQVREKLKYFATSDNDIYVRINCILTLGKYKSDETKNFLKQVIENEKVKEVKDTAIAIFEQTFGKENK